MSEFKFLREMPSSLNDACRSMELAADEIERLRATPNCYQLRDIALKAQPHLGHSFTFADGDLLCYYAGFNLSEFARRLLGRSGALTNGDSR